MWQLLNIKLCVWLEFPTGWLYSRFEIGRPFLLKEKKKRWPDGMVNTVLTWYSRERVPGLLQRHQNRGC
jgi:hypothetical protein